MGQNFDEQRMSAQGFEEPDLSYAPPEETKVNFYTSKRYEIYFLIPKCYKILHGYSNIFYQDGVMQQKPFVPSINEDNASPRSHDPISNPTTVPTTAHINENPNMVNN